MLYPLTFKPIFKERVWGGRKIEQLYHKALPAGVPIGESWEISDRPGDASVIANGPLAGKDLRWLMEHHAEELLGARHTSAEKFPLLVKILDAQEKLSRADAPAATAFPARRGFLPAAEIFPRSCAALPALPPRDVPSTSAGPCRPAGRWQSRSRRPAGPKFPTTPRSALRPAKPCDKAARFCVRPRRAP